MNTKKSYCKWKNDVARVQNWSYSEETDEYICSCGRILRFQYERSQKSKNGYQSIVRVYESADCSGCPHRDRCVKKSGDPTANRRIYINRRGNELKAEARANLTSEYGLQMRSLRPVEVESAFGNIKGNFGMRRFTLKGMAKVNLE